MSTKHMLLDRLVYTSISSTLVQPDIDVFKRKDAEKQLLCNPSRPYVLSWKVNLVPKLILSVTM